MLVSNYLTSEVKVFIDGLEVTNANFFMPEVQVVEADSEESFLQKLLGHANIQTTRIYVKSTEAKTQAAYNTAGRAFDSMTARKQASAETDDVFAGI